VTTRKQWLAESFQQLELTVLDDSAAEELLATLIGENRLQQEPQQVKLLCEDLGYLPLGLELVGRYLKRKSNLSLAEMRDRLNLDHNALQKRDRKGEAFPDMTAKRGVEAAFELSWQELDEEERELACLLSVFASAPIAWEWVEQSQPEQDIEELEEIRDDVLVNLSLLQDEGNNTYQLHPLIREFLKHKRQQRESADNMKQAVCKVMVAIAEIIDQTPIREDILAVTPAIPHITEVAEVLTDWLSNEDLFWPFTALGRFYKGQGLYSQAEPYHQQCLEICQTRLGESHPDVAASLNNLAGLYDSQGKYTEAEPLLQQALQMYKQLLGPSHPNVAASLNNLAYLYKSQGRDTEAKPLYKQALQISKQLLGDYHPDVATILNNLAHLYKSQGRDTEAEPLLQQALEMLKQLLGEFHPDVAASLNNLAGLYDSQGKYTEADPLYLKAVKIAIETLGEDHPNTQTFWHNYLIFLQQVAASGRQSELSEESLQILSQLE
jgi:tetratricopeptide (TPR) repeat protein